MNKYWTYDGETLKIKCAPVTNSERFRRWADSSNMVFPTFRYNILIDEDIKKAMREFAKQNGL